MNQIDIAKLRNYLIVLIILSNTKDHQWRHTMLCFKVSNNKTNDYSTCQSLFDIIKLTISPNDKESIRKLNKHCNVINKSVTY